MISKEDAISRAKLELTPEVESRIANVIGAIYSTIGTCGECDRWDELRDGYGDCFMCDETALWHKNEFCSRFERKV